MGVLMPQEGGGLGVIRATNSHSRCLTEAETTDDESR